MKKCACHRQVSIEEGDAKAREFNVMFIETSAKAGFNIKVCSNPSSAISSSLKPIRTCAREVMSHYVVRLK